MVRVRLLVVLVGLLALLAGGCAPPPGAAPGTAATPELGPTVYMTRTGRRYHRDGCPNVRQGAVAVPLSEAQRLGLTPCPVCKP